MTLTIDNVVRVGRGGAATSSTSTAITVTLDASGTTAADSVVFVGLIGEGLTFATPSGWAVVGTPANGLSVYRRGPVEGLAAGESTWNFTPSATAGKAVAAAAVEVSDADPAATIEVVGAVTLQSGGTGFALNAGLSSTYDGLAIAFASHRDNANATPATFTDWTNGAPGAFDEVLEQGQAGTGNSVDIAVGVRTVQSIVSAALTVTVSRTLTAGAPAVGLLFVINAIGARHASDMFGIDGAEHGTITGNATGPAAYRLHASASAGVTVSAAAARSGGFGWAFDSTSAACERVLNVVLLAVAGNRPAYRRCFDLRGNTTPRRLWSVQMMTVAANFAEITISLDAAGKLVCDNNPAPTQQSDQTVPTSGWFAVEFRFDLSSYVPGSSSTWYADWAVDYDASLTDIVPAVPQVQVPRTDTLSGTIQQFTERVGWNSAVTSAMYSDDGAAVLGQNYPIGDLRVQPMPVDPAGTITVTTTTNFGTMLNGSITAWNATTARGAIDDIPPTTGTSRDALVALLASTTDHAKIPLTNYDLAANKVAARGFKWIMPMWAASATASTCRVKIYDGTTEHIVYAEADPNADNAATPIWLAGVLRPAAAPITWTQAVVNALQVWFGSNDGNPDIGPEMVVGELATVKALPEGLSGSPGDPVYVEAHRDPATLGLVGFTVNTDASTSATVDWDDNGSTGSTGVVGPSSSQYQALSADSALPGVTLTVTPS